MIAQYIEHIKWYFALYKCIIIIIIIIIIINMSKCVNTVTVVHY